MTVYICKVSQLPNNGNVHHLSLRSWLALVLSFFIPREKKISILSCSIFSSHLMGLLSVDQSFSGSYQKAKSPFLLPFQQSARATTLCSLSGSDSESVDVQRWIRIRSAFIPFRIWRKMWKKFNFSPLFGWRGRQAETRLWRNWH
jgi:hypothetical protein